MVKTLALALLLALSPVVPDKAEVREPFCKAWNTMGDDPGGDPITRQQRAMFHLSYFVMRSDDLRELLNKKFPGQTELVDATITCYEENAMFVVEDVDYTCKCTEEDKSDEVAKVITAYVNDCLTESFRTLDKK